MFSKCWYFPNYCTCLRPSQCRSHYPSWKHFREIFLILWNNASHRIAGLVVQALWTRGGLGAPDLLKYYYATHLRAIASLMSRYAPNRWSGIEMGVTSPAHPCYMLWPSSDKYMPQLRSVCLAMMLFALLIWKRCSSRYSLSSPCSPFVNILFNPDIPDS